MSIKLKLSVVDNDFRQARSDWEKLKELAYKDGGEAQWLQTPSAFVHESAALGQLEFLRKLVGPSSPEEPLFPLARALEYVIEGDETLIEKLSPEVRRIVDEIVDSLKRLSPAKKSEKKPAKRQRKSPQPT